MGSEPLEDAAPAECPAGAPAPGRVEPARRGRATAALVAFAPVFVEYLLLSASVDSTELGRLPGAEQLQTVGLVGITTVAALLFVGGRALMGALVAGAADARARPRAGRAVAHLLAFGAFYALTLGTARDLPPAAALPDAALGALWVGLGLATFASWLALTLPPAVRRWVRGLGFGRFALAASVGASAVFAGESLERFWPELARGTLHLASAALSLVGANVWVDLSAPALGIDGFYVRIAPECSGVEGMGLMAVLVPAYLAVVQKELRFPRALAAIPLGVAAAYAANGLRIAALVAVGRFVSVDVAIAGFHSKAGWVAICAIAGFVVLGTRRWASREEAPPVTLVEGPVVAFLLPELVLLAVSLLTGLFAAGVDRLYALRVVAAAAALAYATRGKALRGAFSPSLLPVAAGAAVYALWLALAREAPEDPTLAAFLAGLGPAERVFWLAARVLGGVVVVPLVEELAFRGFLMRYAERRAFDAHDPREVGARGLLVSSLVFALLHSSVLAALVAGLAYGLVYKRRGRLGDAIVAHAVTNGLLACEALALGHYGRL